MRIVQLLSQTHLTGAEAHAVTLAESLMRQGHEVVLISDAIHLATRAKFIARPIHRARGWLARWKEVFWLRRYLKEGNVDIVHAHSRAAVRIAWWATRGLSTALVSTIHGRQHSSLGKKLFDTYGERVIAVCDALKEHLIADFRMRRSRIRVISNPLEFSENIPFETLQDGPPRSPRWLLVTRWSGPKGRRAIELLRDVLTPLLNSHPELSVHWAGAAPAAGSPAETLLNEMHGRFGQRFHGLGFIDPLEEKFEEYDLILGAGRVALAAIGRGRPCFSFGEAATCGLITESNMKAALASNFGDIAADSADRELDRGKSRAELEHLLDFSPPAPAELWQLAQIVRERSDTSVVTKEIFDVYLSARLLKHHPRPIPVLMYHQVVETPIETPHRIFVTKETFRTHLQAFRRAGRQTLVFQDLLDFKEGRRPLSEFPRKPVILTFDDGYENNLKLALPLLKEFNFRAVIYLLADTELNKNTWDEGASPQVPLMTLEQRREFAKEAVFEIGSHGFRHARLPGMSHVEAMTELAESKTALEAEFKRPILSFAFTYGDIDEDSAFLAEQAGYRYALNTDRGAIHIEEDPHAVFRVNVFPEDGAQSILKKTSWWYRWRYYWKRGR